MCTEPLYAIRLKTEFDKKFQRTGKRAGLIVLKAVRDIGKNVDKLRFNRDKYDLLMISCGQCMQCRLQRVKQRAVMSMCELLDHDESSYITLTFGYPQTYHYYRHEKGLSHYLSSKKAHFHAWSLETEFFQKFMKRLRNWFYCYQLCQYLEKIGRIDLIPSSYFEDGYVTHVYIKDKSLLCNFKPKKIRCMHCGEYGVRFSRAHHHALLYGVQFPDLKVVYYDGKKYFESNILSKLWPFGIHTIGEVTYNSSAYVSRYVTKKVNGNNQENYYEGRKPEYVTYSKNPVLGANYFIKNYKEIVNTQELTVFYGKKLTCHMPKSYDNILKKIDKKMYNDMKEKRVNDSKTDLDQLLKQDRSIYSKLDSNNKICMSVLRKLVRSYENNAPVNFSSYLQKAKAFGVNVKYFASEFKDNAIKFLVGKTYKDHKSYSSNKDLHDKYYKFELARKRHINACYNHLNLSDSQIISEICFYTNMPNPYKCAVRGKTLPDLESIDRDSYINEKGEEICY